MEPLQGLHSLPGQLYSSCHGLWTRQAVFREWSQKLCSPTRCLIMCPCLWCQRTKNLYGRIGEKAPAKQKEVMLSVHPQINRQVVVYPYNWTVLNTKRNTYTCCVYLPASPSSSFMLCFFSSSSSLATSLLAWSTHYCSGSLRTMKQWSFLVGQGIPGTRVYPGQTAPSLPAIRASLAAVGL